MGSSRLSGRKSKKSGGSKSVSYYEKAFRDKKIKLIPEKKKLKSQIESSTGAKKKALEKSLSNLQKGWDKYTNAREEKRKSMPKYNTHYEGPKGTTTTYDRFRKNRKKKVEEFMGLR